MTLEADMSSQCAYERIQEVVYAIHYRELLIGNPNEAKRKPGQGPLTGKELQMLNRLILISLVLLMVLPLSSMAQNAKILLFVPEEDPDYLVSDLTLKIEAGAMIDILEGAGYKVDVATPSGNPILLGMTSFQPDFKICEVSVDNYVGLILPSVRTRHRESISSEAAEIVRQFAEQGKPIAAQAYGIAWLGDAGVLSGKKFAFVSASVNDFRLKSRLHDGILIDNHRIVKDGNIITSGVCPDISRRFNLPVGTKLLTRRLINEIEMKQI